MSVVRINAITVPADAGDELARRFAARAGAVEHAEGFEEFQLLRPTDDRTTWLVYTRWKDEASFTKWTESMAFQHGHRGASGGGEASEGAPPEGHPPPVSTAAELWAYDVVQQTAAAS